MVVTLSTVPPWPLVEPAAARREGAVGGALQDDVDDGVDRARRELLALGENVARGIIDQTVQRLPVEKRGHHRFDSFSIADVAAMGGDLAAGRLAEFFGRCRQHLLPPPADRDFGAEFQQMPRHALAKPGAAAGDQDALAGKKIISKHFCNVPRSDR